MKKIGLINKYFLCSIIFFMASVAIGVLVDVVSERFENKKLIEFNADYELSESVTKASKKINALILHAHYTFSNVHEGDKQEHVERYFEDYKKLKNYMDASIGIKKSYDKEIIFIRNGIVEIHGRQILYKKEYYDESILLAIRLGNLSRIVENDTRESFLKQEQGFSAIRIGYFSFIVVVYIILISAFILFNKIVFIDPLRALVGSIFEISKSNTQNEIPFLSKKDEIGMLASAIQTIQKKVNTLGIDSLTGVKNRLFLENDLSFLSGFYFIYIDIDQFKLINDRHGHHFGDAVLREVSKILCENLGKRDGVYRIGGDEFLMTVEGSREDVGYLIERLFEALAEPIVILGRPVTLFISVGVKYCPAGRDVSHDLYAADKGMYQAKKTLGNSCTYVIDNEMTLA